VSVNFEAMSFDELQSAISSANGQVQRMNGLHTKFAHGATIFGSSGEQVVTARNRVSGGWDGKAHDAASQAMTTMNGYMTQSQSASKQSATSMQGLAKTTRSHHEQAQAVPKVDTSFGASMRATGGHPLNAVVDNIHRHEKAQANQEKAAKIATSLNEQGNEHAATMRSADWPAVPQGGKLAPPPDLPPPPGAPTTSGSGGSSSPYSPGGSPRGGGATPVLGLPGGRGVKGSGLEPAGTKHPPKNPPTNPTATDPAGSTTTTAGIGAPTVAGGPAGSSGTTSAAGPEAGAAPTAGGSAALAGAGIGLAGGAAGLGLRGVPGEPGLGGTRGGLAAGEEAELRGGARGTGVGAGEEAGLRGGARGTGVGAGEESPLRGGARGGVGAGEESPLRGGLRGGAGSGAGEEAEAPNRYGRYGNSADPFEARPGGAGDPLNRVGSGGLGAQEVAAEHGGMGPMGGGGRRRSDDDEEQALPDYLVESNDAWAGDQSASPAVIGE
jgi:hypothetical protein